MIMWPWYVHNSIFWLEDRIQPDWRCFEWGSGGSTIWLAELSACVVSMEHDPDWWEKVRGWIIEHGFSDKAKVVLSDLDGNYADYISRYEDNYFDLIAIDGRRRANCTGAAIPKLKPGGLLVVDNSERADYQAALAPVKAWEHIDFVSGWSTGWTTSVYFRRINE